MVERPSRRGALAGTAAALGLAMLRPAGALPADVAREIDKVLAGRTAREGRIVLDIPRLAESGLNVSLDVSVESPMTAEDHVRTIHLFAEQNPLPVVARFHFTPRSGRAAVSTRIRLADTQNVIALAEMNDGTLWRTQAEVVITIMACGLEPI